MRRSPARPRARNRVLITALTISGLFHLSMVSVFQIMIWFPRHDIEYFRVEIVRQQPAARVASSEVPVESHALRVRSSEELFGGDDADVPGDPLAVGWDALPPIDLPRIEFAELDRLRTREESLQIRSQFTELFDARPKDSWALFSEELRGLGQRLRSGLAGGDAVEAPRRPTRVGSPAPGFSIYVQWMQAPYERELLFSPPVQALWDVDAVELAQPIALVFTVNAQGKVTEIQIPMEDEAGLVSAIGSALMKYRFAPLREGDQNQRGTLLLAPETGADEESSAADPLRIRLR